MKTQKPLISPELAVEYNLDRLIKSARESDKPIKGFRFKDLYMEGEDLSYLSFENCAFENCILCDCDFEKSSFTNVLMTKCNFSNNSFYNGYFSRFEFSSGKLVGSHFHDTILKDVTLKNSSLMYAVMEACRISPASFESCDFTSAEIVKSSLKAVDVRLCRFIATSFFGTSLGGIDFSNSELNGIKVSEGFRELKNAVVSSAQAMELATLLGVKIK